MEQTKKANQVQKEEEDHAQQHLEMQKMLNPNHLMYQ
jgi:hypothetical protein